MPTENSIRIERKLWLHANNSGCFTAENRVGTKGKMDEDS
jgi:hypothetical protein